jgi:hypothetical protein
MTSIKKELVTYRNNRISRTKGTAAAVTTLIPNDRNQITSMSGPRPQAVQGYTNEPSNVTINGTRTDNARHKRP